MAFQIKGIGNLGQVVTGRLKVFQALQVAPLQELGKGPFNRCKKTVVGAEGSEDSTALGIGEEGTDYRKLSA